MNDLALVRIFDHFVPQLPSRFIGAVFKCHDAITEAMKAKKVELFEKHMAIDTEYTENLT